ncbi:MAG: SOS response-associated peptidase family protein [Alphaproteobacteria bacterium]|nr:SOS response-associated peptidase family protein [Alphaproteobacteria bacterium]
MCNYYRQSGTSHHARRLAALLGRTLRTTPQTDNPRPQDGIYPDQDAPILLNGADGALELVRARWGFPAVPGQSAPITNIRNLKSQWWRDVNRAWITEAAYRCLVPFTEFAEPVRDPTWFAVPGVEVACFAGVWRPWRGERLVEPPGQKRRAREERDWRLYAFLTTEANAVVRPIHEKAMPVILVDPAEQAEWLGGGTASLRLQRPLPSDQLTIVAASWPRSP